MILVIMGVCGCGKTTIGKRVAWDIGASFHDADDYHPEANVKKMASGTPLTDEDRWPWLQRMAEEMPKWEKGASGSAVLACSALKKAYRDILEQGTADVRFVFLKVSKKVILERVGRRHGSHFMPPELVESQFDALEEPTDAIVVDATRSPIRIAQAILEGIEPRKTQEDADPPKPAR